MHWSQTALISNRSHVSLKLVQVQLTATFAQRKKIWNGASENLIVRIVERGNHKNHSTFILYSNQSTNAWKWLNIITNVLLISIGIVSARNLHNKCGICDKNDAFDAIMQSADFGFGVWFTRKTFICFDFDLLSYQNQLSTVRNSAKI